MLYYLQFLITAIVVLIYYVRVIIVYCLDSICLALAILLKNSLFHGLSYWRQITGPNHHRLQIQEAS